MNVQSNETMRMVSGTIRSTSIVWLPVVYNIALPSLRMLIAAKRDWNKTNSHIISAKQLDVDNLPNHQTYFKAICDIGVAYDVDL